MSNLFIMREIMKVHLATQSSEVFSIPTRRGSTWEHYKLLFNSWLAEHRFGGPGFGGDSQLLALASFADNPFGIDMNMTWDPTNFFTQTLNLHLHTS